ncbi:homoserine dehydrogenase [Robbsia sp. KACC 23696]|uniref:homoserine dehydrogenase n=1 Tax=Robbsia sp. KACC 23696 TaxID=3149231 RepID=UPI00325AE32D
MKRWNVAITGFGAIGKSVAALLDQRRAHYQARYGADVRLVGVCGSRAGCFAPSGLVAWSEAQPWASQDGLTGPAFLDTVQPDVLIESGPTDYLTGGAGERYIRQALTSGIDVIAISKGALVRDYRGLRQLAETHGARLKISGATSAALPTIDLLQYNLTGCTVERVEGIVTETTNFILSRMMDGERFEDALASAQQHGIAEPDPRFDIEGWDSAIKITILANAAFDADVRLESVVREGIAAVTPAQIADWRARGLVPKLVACIDRMGDHYHASVRLKTYDSQDPFSQVRAGMKAIRVHTDAMGETLVISKNGPTGTAAAALKDLEHLLMQDQRTDAC